MVEVAEWEAVVDMAPRVWEAAAGMEWEAVVGMESPVVWELVVHLVHQAEEVVDMENPVEWKLAVGSVHQVEEVVVDSEGAADLEEGLLMTRETQDYQIHPTQKQRTMMMKTTMNMITKPQVLVVQQQLQGGNDAGFLPQCPRMQIGL